MLNRILTQVRHNAVAYAALFIALSGTAFAASSLPRNSSGSTQSRAARVHSRAARRAHIATLRAAKAAKKSHHGVSVTCPSGHAIEAISKRGKATCLSVGSITGVVAGTGLSGGGSSGRVVVGINPRVVQARISGNCGAGRAISGVRPQGAVTCHTTNTSQMMGGTGTATLSSASDFMSPTGISAPSTQVAAAEVGSSNAPSRARNLFVRVATAPATGTSRTFDFYVNGTERTALKCVITGPANTCHANGSVALPRGAQVALHATVSGSPAATTATFGWTATIF